jgi:hypothetical protein
LQDPAKLTQIEIFGLKKYHLATLNAEFASSSFVTGVCVSGKNSPQ